MTQVRIVRVPFLLPTWAAAQVLLPNLIFVRRDQPLTVRLLAHELDHVEQIRRMGLLRYWLVYLRDLIRLGYDSHPMEAEAYEVTWEEEDEARRYLARWQAARA